MKKLVLHIALLINLTLFCYQQTNAQCHIDDWTALKALYQSTNGENWTNKTGWEEVTANNPSANCNLESLFGVGLDGVGRVNCIDLNDNNCNTNGGYDGNNLTGSIPPEIGNLTNLTYLEFRKNQIGGNIPPEIGNLSSLKKMIIDNNQFTGSIPKEIGNLNNLEELEIDYNQLSGSIPVELGDLSNLEELNLAYNQLTGNIPIELGNLSKLTMLNLYNNQLDGNIPLTLGILDVLEFLDLGLNQLEGNIPAELGNLKELTNLRLASNNLTGSIPETLGNLGNLTKLRLNSNQLKGNIPVELYQLKNLIELRLNNNQLDGELQPALGNLCNLILLSLNHNQFSGNIPPEMGNLDTLFVLNLNNNQFRGSIPTELSNQNNLVFYNIAQNYFPCSTINSIPQQIFQFNYSPQFYTPENYDSLRINIFDTLSAMQPVVLSVEYTWEESLNITYQWKRNGKTIPGATQPNYSIDNIKVQDAGKYTLHIFSDNCRPNGEVFELISDPIYVFLKGYDLYGQPVSYDQIMVEFDNAEETQKYKNEILLNPDRTGQLGEVAKSCNCNRELYLWEFPTTERAIEALLEIDRKTKSIKKKSNIKGDFNNLLSVGETDRNSNAFKVISNSLNANYPDSTLIFILDTGLDEEGFNAKPFIINHAPVDSCYGIEEGFGYSYVDSIGTPIPATTIYQDEHWHGTYGFRAITDNLTENHPFKIVPLKIFDKDGSGNLFDLTCALYHAIDHNADVVNISAGYQGQPSEILESAINFAREKNVFITTASGNEAINIDSLPQYPAYYAGQYYKFVTDYDALGNAKFDSTKYDNVISVTSINELNEISSFGNFGKQSVTLAAYGEKIYGYGLGGAEIVASGTSMATFFVTKELALEIATNQNRNYTQIWSDFEENRLVDGGSSLKNITQTGKRLKVELERAEISGCTDSDACNYFDFATIDDGTCEYETCNDCAFQSYEQTIYLNSVIDSTRNYIATESICIDEGFYTNSDFSATIEDCR